MAFEVKKFRNDDAGANAGGGDGLDNQSQNNGVDASNNGNDGGNNEPEEFDLEVEMPGDDDDANKGSQSNAASASGDDKNNDAAATKQAIADWKELIKGVDKKEVLKALNHEELELDDWEKEFITHRKNGGSVEDYLNAKAKDWDKIEDADLTMLAAQKQYPNLNEEEIEQLLIDKYKLSEDYTEAQRALGKIQMKADAHIERELQKQQQSKFTIKDKPSIEQPNQEEIQKQQIQEVEAIRQKVLTHEVIKSMVTDKKVVLNVDGIGKLNIPISNPKLITDFMNHADVQQKYMLDAKGEPDMHKAQHTALLNILGPEKYASMIANYSKGAAKRELVDAARNISKNNAPIGGNNSEKQNARIVTDTSGD